MPRNLPSPKTGILHQAELLRHPFIHSIIFPDFEINTRAQDTVVCIEREIYKYHILDGESVYAAACFVELKIRIDHSKIAPNVTLLTATTKVCNILLL
jgi:hypothetical protein